MNAELLTLPWQVQIALGSGYAAYVVANVGNRAHHKPVDIAFSALVFGLFASVFYGLAAGRLGDIPGGLVAFAGTVVVGALWSKVGRAVFRWLLRKLRISFANDDPSALSSIMMDTRHDVTQASVRLDDGTWLRWDDTKQFEDFAFKPIAIGPQGDVAMYLTHYETPEGAVREQSTVRNEQYGDRIVIVPAARVREIFIRHKRPR